MRSLHKGPFSTLRTAWNIWDRQLLPTVWPILDPVRTHEDILTGALYPYPIQEQIYAKPT